MTKSDENYKEIQNLNFTINRYELRLGKFGFYFFDNEENRQLPLYVVLKRLNSKRK